MAGAIGFTVGFGVGFGVEGGIGVDLTTGLLATGVTGFCKTAGMPVLIDVISDTVGFGGTFGAAFGGVTTTGFGAGFAGIGFGATGLGAGTTMIGLAGIAVRF